MQALIEAYKLKPDARIRPAIAAAILDVLWERAWLPSRQTFFTMKARTPLKARPDLNLIIARHTLGCIPELETGNNLSEGMKSFSSAVKYAYLLGINSSTRTIGGALITLGGANKKRQLHLPKKNRPSSNPAVFNGTFLGSMA